MSTPYQEQLMLDQALDAVSTAEKMLIGASEAIRSSLESIERSIERGLSLNELGELQSRGPALDVAVARHEEAVRSFRTIYRFARLAIVEDPSDTPAEALWKDTIRDRIMASPRLANEVRK